MYLRASAAVTANFGTLTIKMGHSTLTTFTAGPFVTGLTTVYNGPATISTVSGNWMVITLTTPFAYNNTQNLIIEASQTGYSPGFSVMQTNTGVPMRSIFGSIGAATGSTQDRLAEAGFDMIVAPCTSPPAAGTATSSLPNVCQGSPVNLNLTGNSIGIGQTYQWQSATSIGGPYTNVGSSLTSPGTTVSPVANTFYRCMVTCSAVSANSAPVQVTVNTPLTPAISIVSDTNDVCAGTIVNFTATPVNGGGLPSYQWKRNGSNVGTDSPTYSSAAFLNNDLVTCELTTSETCITGPTALSNTITMEIESKLPTSVTVAADPSNEICEGESITFTATPVNGGTPSYQWKKNGVNVGTNSDVYTDGALVNADVVRCEMTSSETCVTLKPAAAVVITKVNPLPAKPFVTFNGNILTSTVTASGYQWNKDGIPLPGDTLQSLVVFDSGWYSVTVIDEKGCSNTSNPIFNWGVVGIDVLKINGVVSIYPVPFRKNLTVVLENGLKYNQMEVRNLAGQLVYQSDITGNKTESELSFLQSGIYLMILKGMENSFTTRIIRE